MNNYNPMKTWDICYESKWCTQKRQEEWIEGKKQLWLYLKFQSWDHLYSVGIEIATMLEESEEWIHLVDIVKEGRRKGEIKDDWYES